MRTDSRAERPLRWLDESPDAVALLDGEGRFLYVNRAVAEAAGRPREAFLGRTLGELGLPTGDRALWDDAIERVLGGSPADFEFRVDVNGEPRLFHVRMVPDREADGSISGLLSFGRDVTPVTRRAERALAEATQRLEALMDAVPVGISFSEDVTCHRITGNRTVAEQFEWARRDNMSASAPDPGAPGRRVRFRIGDRDLAPEELPLQRAVTENRIVAPIEAEVILPSGRRWTMEGSGAPVRNAHGEVVAGIAVTVDITERKRAEAALRESEEKLRTAFSNASIGFAIALPDGRFEEANPAYCELTGYTLAELRNMTFSAIVHPDDQQVNAALTRRMVEGELPGFVIENRYVRKGGGEIWVRKSVSIVRDPDGQPRWNLALIEDITPRKEAQLALERAVVRLQENDRRKNEFLALLSHELRNPLAPIANALHVLERTPAGDHRARALLEMIGRQTRHIARIVDDLLDVNRIVTGKIHVEHERVDLGRLALECADDLRPSFAERRIEFTTHVATGRIHVLGDATRLGQVIGNLLNNATKFTPPGGRVELRVERIGATAIVTVSDTGIGIDAAMLERIFDPFAQAERVTVKSQGGLGLGLALVKGIVELLGGSVAAASPGPGCGASFTLHLPLLADADAAAKRDDVADHDLPLRILVIDDNADAADSLGSLLEQYGHTVATASTAAEGLARWAVFGADAIVCDIGLPDLDGYEVARRIRAGTRGPAPRLIALTGYGMDEDRARSSDAGFDGHLTKPAPIDELRRMLTG